MKTKTFRDMAENVKTSFRVKSCSPVGAHSDRMRIPLEGCNTIGFTVTPEQAHVMIANLSVFAAAGRNAIITVYRKGTKDGDYQATVVGDER